MKITFLSRWLRAALPLTAFVFLVQSCLVAAQAPSSSFDTPYKVGTQWPGIDFRVVDIERIIQNRVMVVVRIEATKEAPAGGTLIGSPPVIPAYVKIEADRRRFAPTPFVVAGSTMTDESRAVAYPMLSPIAPRGHGYLPGACMASLRPGDTVMFSLQFAAPPPPPPPAPGQPPVVQTLSFLFTKATGPIAHVPLPPMAATAAVGSP